MYFFEDIIGEFENSRALCIVLPIVCFALLAFAIVSFFCKSKELFFAFCLIVYGGMESAIFALSMTESGAKVCRAFTFMGAGSAYVLLYIAFCLKERKEERKKRRAQILRKMQFTLPDRDNTFVQDRLKTALQPPEKKQSPCQAEQTQNQAMKLEHVRKLLSKLKEAPLTKAERIETEEMSKMFCAYLHKNKWTSEDVRAMNELFSSLLKMASKYAV